MIKNYTLTSLFFLLGLLISNVAQGQKEIPSKDILYLKDGSIIQGQITYNAKKSPDEVTLDVNGEIRKFTVNEAEGFLLEHQEKYIVKDLQTKEIDSKNYFTRLIFEGEFNLYQLLGRFYIEDKNNRIIPLQKSEVGNFTKKEKSSKYHLSILSYLIQGACKSAGELTLEKIQLNDESLSNYLSTFHECQGIAYSKYVDTRPRLQINYYALVGVNHTRLNNSRESLPVMRKISKTTIPTLQAGLRLDELRGMPRVSMDFLIGISSQQNTIDFFYEDNVYRYNVSTDYTLQTISANWFVNYSFLKTKNFDLYAGLGPMNRVNFYTSKYGMTEQIRTTSGFANLFEGQVFDIASSTLGLGFKLGSVLKKNNRSRITAELIMDYTPRGANVNLMRLAYFDQINTAIMIGYSFRHLKK